MQFLFSTDFELCTVVEGTLDPQRRKMALERLLDVIRDQVPWLRGPSGLFTPYGRFYIDLNQHFEAALPECDSPYMLATLHEQVCRLLRKAVDSLQRRWRIGISLANNNHSGVFRPNHRDIWGFHECYLVDVHPRNLPEDLVLPFLATRVYQGSGVIMYPSGTYLAGARAHCMDRAVGGATHEHGRRAIHSTARDENHMGPDPDRFRYHLLPADGHRAHFNLALLFGASALTWRAILVDRQLKRRLPRLVSAGDGWTNVLRRFNVLAKPGQPPRVDPLVVATQREYLAACRRLVDGKKQSPPWAGRVLRDWSDTLDAMEHGDRAWLAARLDAFLKHKFFSLILRDRGKQWTDLIGDKQLCAEMELINHSYHEITDPDSYFDQLEEAGELADQVAPTVAPGSEPNIPQTETRAKARARFIVENAGDRNLVMDWGHVVDRRGRCRTLWNPFGQVYSQWEEEGPPSTEIDGLVSRMLLSRRSDEIPF